jgi:uracil-DNA glycosylase
MNVNTRRTRFIQEMGVGPVWQQRRGLTTESAAPEKPADVILAQDSKPEADNTHIPFSGVDEAVRMPVEMNIGNASHVNGTAPAPDEVSHMNWEQLQQNVASCVKCRLCQTRTKTVFGVGDEEADWLFVGEGPGRNEDMKGEPFVGPAGKLLDNMLLSLGLRRGENAYIANTVKCRPIGQDGRDRPPAIDEAEACRPYLERQIDLIKPKIIVALGKTAAISLLGLDPDMPVTKLRGQVHEYRGLPLIVTYHPAYLLRKLSEKSKSWSDLCLAMRTYADNPR